MKKSDLKTGMWVEYRDGKKACVMVGTDATVKLGGATENIITDGDTWLSLKCLTDDLMGENNSERIDIMKVYRPNTPMDCYAGKRLTLIWEREESIEMTLEEACKILRDTMGKPVKITI
jgi:hypothetical protein